MHDTTIPFTAWQQDGSTDLLDPLDRVRIINDATHLYGLGGPRPLGEVLITLAETCGTAAVLDVLAQYRWLTPETVKAAGGDRFPPILWLVRP